MYIVLGAFVVVVGLGKVVSGGLTVVVGRIQIGFVVGYIGGAIVVVVTPFKVYFFFEPHTVFSTIIS
jgi:hypothetical protein